MFVFILYIFLFHSAETWIKYPNCKTLFIGWENKKTSDWIFSIKTFENFTIIYFYFQICTEENVNLTHWPECSCVACCFFLIETPKSLLHDASILDQWTCKSISSLTTCKWLNWVDSFSVISSRNLPFYSSFYQIIITITTTDVASFSYFFRTCLMKHQLTINEELTPPKLKPLSA